MHKNVPPAHFGYMASGVDDDVTLRANREGFLKFQLRPRRLIDVSKIDMSTEILGQKYNTPIIIAPTGGHRGYHPDGEEGVARAAKAGDHLMVLSTQATASVSDVIAARGRPIWSQLYATNKFEVAKHHIQSMERQGSIAVAVTVDRVGERNQETALRMRASDSRQCSGCHDRSNLTAANRDKPMYEGADLAGLKNMQSSALTWDDIRRLRDLTKMKMVIKGISAWEDAKIAADAGIDAIIVSNHGGRSDEAGRSTIESLPEIIQASGNMPVLIDSASPRYRLGKGALYGRQRRYRCRPTILVGSWRLWSGGCRPRARNPAHGTEGSNAAGRRAVAQISHAGNGHKGVTRIDRGE
jgi:4-hydroxymandelate oxidase